MLTKIDTGLWLEPTQGYAASEREMSGELVRVLGVKSLDGPATRCSCVTHHGAHFECSWYFLATNFVYAAEATVFGGQLESGFDSV